MFSWIFWGFVIATGTTTVLLTIDAIIEQIVKSFFSEHPHIENGNIIKIEDINDVLQNVSPEKRPLAKKIMEVLNAKSNNNNIVMFGEDYFTGKLEYKTLSDEYDCEDLDGAYYKVTRSGHREKIYI